MGKFVLCLTAGSSCNARWNWLNDNLQARQSSDSVKDKNGWPAGAGIHGRK